jgi:hypothetical protein
VLNHLRVWVGEKEFLVYWAEPSRPLLETHQYLPAPHKRGHTFMTSTHPQAPLAVLAR